MLLLIYKVSDIVKTVKIQTLERVIAAFKCFASECIENSHYYKLCLGSVYIVFIFLNIFIYFRTGLTDERTECLAAFLACSPAREPTTSSGEEQR